MQSPSLNSRVAHYDVRAPLQFPDGRVFVIDEWRVRHEWNWQNEYIVDFEFVEVARNWSYLLQVRIHWEERHNDERCPSEQAIMTIARQLAWDYFESHRQPPCFSRHQFPIRLEF